MLHADRAAASRSRDAAPRTDQAGRRRRRQRARCGFGLAAASLLVLAASLAAALSPPSWRQFSLEAAVEAAGSASREAESVDVGPFQMRVRVSEAVNGTAPHDTFRLTGTLRLFSCKWHGLPQAGPMAISGHDCRKIKAVHTGLVFGPVFSLLAGLAAVGGTVLALRGARPSQKAACFAAAAGLALAAASLCLASWAAFMDLHTLDDLHDGMSDGCKAVEASRGLGVNTSCSVSDTHGAGFALAVAASVLSLVQAVALSLLAWVHTAPAPPAPGVGDGSVYHPLRG